MAYEARESLKKRQGEKDAGAPIAVGRRTRVEAAAGLQGRSEDSSFLHASSEPFGSLIGATPLPTRKTQANGSRRFKVTLTKPTTDAEFHRIASRQVFGRVVPSFKLAEPPSGWPPEPFPAGNYPILIRNAYIQKVLNETGFPAGEDGRIEGAQERVDELSSGDGGTKGEVIDEVNREFWRRTGQESGTSIKRGDKAYESLWKQIRDELLYLRERLESLPAHLKKLIEESNGRLDPSRYKQVLRILKKLNKMSPTDVADYLSKSARQTSDLDVFEESVDRYLEEMAARREADKAHEARSMRLAGLEESYQLYVELVKAMGFAVAFPQVTAIQSAFNALLGREDTLREKAERLRQSLEAYGFASIGEFVSYIDQFEKGFRTKSATIATDILERYKASLIRAQQRYQSSSTLKAVRKRLGGVRGVYESQQTNEKAASKLEAKRQKIHGRRVTVDPKSEKQLRHEKQASADRQQLETSLDAIDPIFADGELPESRRMNKGRLTSSSASELGKMIQSHLAQRIIDARGAIALVEGDTKVIYKMEVLRDHFRRSQSITSGSIFAMILDNTELLGQIEAVLTAVTLGTLAVALTVASFGSAAPAIFALGGLALGAYSVYDEATEYGEAKTLSNVGLARDPSSVWLVAAVIGLALDAAAAVKALQALTKATRAFNEVGDLNKFTTSIRELERAGAIDGRTANAVIDAAQRKASVVGARTQLDTAFGGRTSIPVSDPDVYEGYAAMARARIASDGPNVIAFIDEVRRARVRAGLDFPADEVTKAKQAYREALESTPKKKTSDTTGKKTETAGKRSSEATLQLRAKFRAKYPRGEATAWRGVRLPRSAKFEGTRGGEGTMVILGGGQNAALHYALNPTKNRFKPSDDDVIVLLQMRIRADDIIAYPQMEALDHVMLDPGVDLTKLAGFVKRELTVAEARALYAR